MKKYNNIDLNWVFVWIILPILIFLFSVNSVYAYFTATAKEQKADISTATISIGFNNDEIATTSKNSTRVVDGNILPGDTIDFSGEVINTGTSQIYCLLEFDVRITGSNSYLSHGYYTSTGVALVKSDSGEYTTGATVIAYKGKSNFTLTYLVPTEFELEDYANKTVTMTITAHALQYAHVGSVDKATKILLGETT